MSINVCEDHSNENAVCIWEYGKKCPMCILEAEVESLKERLETEQDATANAMDRLAEVQEELTAATEEQA